MEKSDFYLAVDPGKTYDPTAHALLQVIRVEHTLEFHVRDLGILPLGTSYDEVVRVLTEKIWSSRELYRATLVVDATGLGHVVVDWFRQAGLEPVSLTITGGANASVEGLNVHVPKTHLIGKLLMLLQSDRLKVAEKLPLTPILKEQLRALRRKESAADHTTFESVGNEHDDLLMAVAMAAWFAAYEYPIWDRPVARAEVTYSEKPWDNSFYRRDDPGALPC